MRNKTQDNTITRELKTGKRDEEQNLVQPQERQKDYSTINSEREANKHNNKTLKNYRTIEEKKKT